MSTIKNNINPIGGEEDCNRFIAFIDIMGFKDLVARRPHSEVKEILEEMTTMSGILEEVIGNPIDANTGKRSYTRFKTITFSDSVVFITKGDSFSDLSVLSVVLKSFQESSIHRGAPTKGAISVGKLTANFEKSILSCLGLLA